MSKYHNRLHSAKGIKQKWWVLPDLNSRLRGPQILCDVHLINLLEIHNIIFTQCTLTVSQRR